MGLGSFFALSICCGVVTIILLTIYGVQHIKGNYYVRTKCYVDSYDIYSTDHCFCPTEERYCYCPYNLQIYWWANTSIHFASENGTLYNFNKTIGAYDSVNTTVAEIDDILIIPPENDKSFFFASTISPATP